MLYLHQAAMVYRLLELISQVIPNLRDDEKKHSLIDALSEFENAITPSAIYLEEVFEYASLESIQLTREEAVKILESAASDIDSNYVSKAIEYHVDLFIQGRRNENLMA